jgi:glycosyltransferase involved in cell wall biosynthesis
MFVAGYLKTVRKGADLLVKALEGLPESCRDQVVILTVGNGGENFSQKLNLPVINLGYVSDDVTKAIAYSAADLFILPTRADNLPVVLQESMACGTPMVSFKVGGVPDLVRHGITGYLANPENAEELCQGIVYLLENNELRENMRKNCREIAVQEYSLELQATRYVKLYETMVNSQSKK